jgi:O-antigen/teichoic acid export membrane protein
LSAQPTSAKVNNTHTIARNSMWYGLELFSGIIGAFLVSIPVARVFGPERMGYYNYLVWLTNITTAVGSFGLPMTTRKYMAEHLNRGEDAVAHAIYRVGVRLQIMVSCLVTIIGLALVYFAGEPSQHLVAVLLVLNMAPRMIGFIPSQANNAAELMKRSTGPALTGGAVTTVLTLLCLATGVGGLEGVAASIVVGAAVEMVLKLRVVRRRMAEVPVAELSPELKKRMLSYSGQGLALMLLNVVVWDRSDLIILKHMNRDIAQVSYFSISFNLTERVLTFPNAFTSALGVTMMAQYGRGRERLAELVVSGAKYSMLLAFPLLLGMACVSGAAVRIYGHQYDAMIPVLALAALFAIPKALIAAPTSLLQTTENQGYLIWVGCCCGVLDVLLDVLLTPGYGARGAAIANGVTQTAAAVAIWLRVRELFDLNLRLREFGRIAVSGAAMCAVTLLITRSIPGYVGILLGVPAGAATWFAGLRVTKAIAPEDADRLLQIGKVLPGRMRPSIGRFVGWMMAGQPAKPLDGVSPS